MLQLHKNCVFYFIFFLNLAYLINWLHKQAILFKKDKMLLFIEKQNVLMVS